LFFFVGTSGFWALLNIWIKWRVWELISGSAGSSGFTGANGSRVVQDEGLTGANFRKYLDHHQGAVDQAGLTGCYGTSGSAGSVD
jgi:hypothetical protein